MKKEFLIYVLFAIVVLLLAWTVYSSFSKPYTNEQYQKALVSENTADICATPSGYTDEQWKEHMSHHPDRYKECLS